jgi:glucose/arabinose dehydrogenase/lysophospholipase L1-like esterase
MGLLVPLAVSAAAPETLKLDTGDRIVIEGNTLAERQQLFGHFETLLQSRFPEQHIVVRNLGWSADELTLRPRSKDFQNHGHRLEDHKPDVVIGMWGFNESFAGKDGLEKFEKDLKDYIKRITTTKYNGEQAPTLVLVSPIATENLDTRYLPDGSANNERIQLYTEAMKRIAAEADIQFVDLFTPSQEAYASSEKPLTINSIHLNEEGYKHVDAALDVALFGPRPDANGKGVDLEKLRAAVQEKDLQFYYDYRAVNGYYIYGGRKNPFGVVNFPAEFAKLRKMIDNRDQRIWAIAAGQNVPPQIDDSNTGDLPAIPTNYNRPIQINSPEDTIGTFTLPEGFQIELFASEVDFPDLRNPVAFCFDAKGRLWVVTMASYPQYLPGTPVNDKVLILEDTNGDGKADKQTVFADGLHLPAGIELGDGGCYVAQQPNLVFLKDTNGDDKADERRIVLHGFDSADSHHAISAFTWGPGGALYFQEGTFHYSQSETPYGPERLANAGVFRWEPRTWKLDAFVSYGFANPWGHTFDDWGQNFVADASGGANYFGTAFSGDVVYPQKHGGMQQFLKKQWRPTSGCEFVSSSNFPKEWQGNYLLNNVIGFHGVLNYRMREEGSGFAADPAEPLVRSSDPNFRPVDLEFGPDGALYLCDWFNPLIGHMQHSLRDPNRDTNHGRIWRVSYKENDLVKPAKIAGASAAELCDLLTAYEYRTRYRTRIALRDLPTEEVTAALESWVAKQKPEDELYWHNLLEALWVYQHHDLVNRPLLEKLLTCPEPKARAAATRVLCYQRDELPDALELLRVQINDEHPRVRLEAVRACSFFEGEQVATAQEVALESLLHDQDYYLEYTLKETNATLDRRAKAQR